MSASAVDPKSPRAQGSARAGQEARDVPPVARVCPYLRSRDGAWSGAQASRELLCWAVEPAAQPSLPKQRQLCVGSEHITCDTFANAETADAQLDRAQAGDAALWPTASSAPVALEALHTRPGVSVGSSRAGGQALLVGLMVVAFLVLVIARANPLAITAASPTPGPSASAVVSAVVAASALPSPSPAPSVAASASPVAPSPSAAPSPTPAASATQRTYKVRSGDTVASIAAKFHTTVTAIVKANKIVDPRTIHPGQVLVIP
jgi:LysM repeat protein